MRVIPGMTAEGPALQAAAIARGLPPDRFEQRVYCGAPARGEAGHALLDAYLDAPDLDVRRLPGLGRPVRPGGDALYLALCLAALVAEMRRFRPHIVHTHTARAGLLGRTAAVLARVPVRVHTFHGPLPHAHRSRIGAGLAVTAERLLARVTDRLVADGERVRDDLLAARIGRPAQYMVVPPGTRLRPLPGRARARRVLGLPEAAPVVAYVGRLTGVKRPDRLVEVARTIHRELPEVHFAVCGDGDQLGEVLAAAPGFDGTLHPLGRRADDEGALLRRIGGGGVMRAQLTHLLEMAELPNVTIQVMPLEGPYHPGARRPVTMLRSAADIVPDVIYCEQLSGGRFYDKPADTTRFFDLLNWLSVHAPSPKETPAILRRLIDHLDATSVVAGPAGERRGSRRLPPDL